MIISWQRQTPRKHF